MNDKTSLNWRYPESIFTSESMMLEFKEAESEDIHYYCKCVAAEYLKNPSNINIPEAYLGALIKLKTLKMRPVK